MELEGTVAFVTGGSGDIGGAFRREPAEAGSGGAVSYVGNADGAAPTTAAVPAP